MQLCQHGTLQLMHIFTHNRFLWICLIALMSFPGNAGAQRQSEVVVRQIDISGIKRTKRKIILRELEIRERDTILIANLSELLYTNRILLMNTGLFNEVAINVSEWDTDRHTIDLDITVEEAWYLYPIPIFELADRNFNVWWKEYDHALNRINIGINLYHNNLTGHNDQLKLKAQYGFTRKYEANYNLPLFGSSDRLGFLINLLYSRNKEIAYRTDKNKLLFYRDNDNFLLKRKRAGVGLIFRPKIKTTHTFSLFYHFNAINTYVIDSLNTDFFNANHHQRFFTLSYNLQYDKRDIKPYPLNGHYLGLTIEKNGLGFFKDLNTTRISITAKKYLSFLRDRFSTEVIFSGTSYIGNKKIPYYNYGGLGFGSNYVRGYEYYVINGKNFFVGKTGFRYRIFKHTITFGDKMPIKAYRKIPVKVYFSVNNDIGYVNDPYYGETNTMNKKLLWGKGIGLDFIVLYGVVFKIEYSINHLKEKGLFLHYSIGI